MQRPSHVVHRRTTMISEPTSSHRASADRDEAATMSVPEAAELLGISESAAYEASARGEIPSIRIGRRVLVVREALMAMLDGATRSQSR